MRGNERFNTIHSNCEWVKLNVNSSGNFAATYLAAWIVRGIWLRNWTIFRQNAIGEKNRAVASHAGLVSTGAIGKNSVWS